MRRYALAVLALVLLPLALAGGSALIRAYDASGRESSIEWAQDYADIVEPWSDLHDLNQVLTGCENGDVIVAGTKSSETSCWYMRVHSDGTIAWFDTVSPSSASIRTYDIINLATPRYLIVTERDASYNGFETWLLCIDEQGNEVWNRSYGTLGNASYPAVGVPCDDGGAVIIASTWSNITGEDLCALRIDPDGIPLWNVTYPTFWPYEWVNDAACAADGSILVLGSVESPHSHECIVRSIEPSGAVRWNQTCYDRFSSIAGGPGGDYVLVSSSQAVCLDSQGRQRWSSIIPMSSGHESPAVVASQNTYFIVSNFYVSSVTAYWSEVFGQSIDPSGAIRWTWLFNGLWTGFSRPRVAASANGGFYILPYSDSSYFLLRLPDPPALPCSTALLAGIGYTVAIVSAIIATALMSGSLPPSATRHLSDMDRDPRVLLKASFAFQAVLLVLWALLQLSYGPVRPYYESYPGSTDEHIVLLFLLLSPVGIANAILGAIAFAGLQVGLYSLDRQLSLERRRRGQPKRPSLLTCACAAFLILLGFYAIVSPALFLSMLPFLNGVLLTGFLPKYVLKHLWT